MLRRRFRFRSPPSFDGLQGALAARCLSVGVRSDGGSSKGKVIAVKVGATSSAVGCKASGETIGESFFTISTCSRPFVTGFGVALLFFLDGLALGFDLGFFRLFIAGASGAGGSASMVGGLASIEGGLASIEGGLASIEGG